MPIGVEACPGAHIIRDTISREDVTVKDVPYHVIDTCELEKGITLCQHFDVFRPPSSCSISFRKACLPSHAKFRGENAKFAILTICLCTKKSIWDDSHGLKLKNGADNYFATEEGKKPEPAPKRREQKPIMIICTDRESNPGLYRGRVLFYH